MSSENYNFLRFLERSRVRMNYKVILTLSKGFPLRGVVGTVSSSLQFEGLSMSSDGRGMVVARIQVISLQG